ncbi:flagellar assembly protein FliW [Poseidonibacter ostreae]|jgi:flagellar assembly factor FliW|uniref:Flagellar biosynthesis protein FliW n=1 Tax=Poseidonibacter ostreae TaxID=2654171 RepID=A0A6L4WQB5_9BACT|nr:flagellar assembly protein FliW [Poseidonibacter ostreae]KAB7886370.1 flagellar biosynthesis protein FliW [Poseidonibacter ostreae]KAB7887485.1 flagellar biosynthesis protein FliW [Poseidonibacter ostreae]KAB7891865.1 flagellar biosynthesis protein FliW [Poseidonibacter ostreae]|tara:strand:+ start:81 stop:458 length:378 start_codon:yes stop_codon:yes gene_type:complete
MYKIELPLLGFEDIKELDIKSVDDNFVTLELNNEKSLNINLVSINYFKEAKFNFNIDDETLEIMNIKNLEDFKIFFCVVMQKPIEDSIVNLAAPVLINEKDKLIGQYVIKDRIPRLLTTLSEVSI